MPQRSELLDHLLRLHESSYLSLMSIVQGVALGFLAARVTTGPLGLVGWLLTAATFGAVVLTWNEYVTGVAVFSWAPTMLDSTIPFLLCGAEIWMSTTISDAPRHWFIALGLFALVSFVAFANMYWCAGRHSRNAWLLRRLAPYHRAVLLMTPAAALIAWLFWLVSPFPLDWLLPLLSFALVAAFIVRTVLYRHALLQIARETPRGPGHDAKSTAA